jgi:hypothetical protein
VEYRGGEQDGVDVGYDSTQADAKGAKVKELGSGGRTPKEEEEESFGRAFVAKRERYGVTITKGLSEHGNTGGVKGEASDTRTCYACGEKGHVRAHCRKRSAECYNCGESGHISSVCRKPRGPVQEVVVKTEGVCRRDLYSVAQRGAGASGCVAR